MSLEWTAWLKDVRCSRTQLQFCAHQGHILTSGSRASPRLGPHCKCLDVCLHRWEYDESYCEAVKKMPPYDAGPRLLDVIDTAVFDYLIGNADRHHYESFQDDGGASMLILLDNAKRCEQR